MKKLVKIFSLVAALTLSCGVAHAESELISSSIQLQQDKIVNAAQAGTLKAADAKTLLQHLDRIKFELKRAKSDGHVNNYETQMLERMLSENAAALQAYQLKAKQGK